MSGKPGMQPTKPRTVPGEYPSGGLLKSMDLRYRAAQIVAAQLAELHETLGGTDALTQQKRALCERSVWLNARLQQMEQEYLGGLGLDHTEYTALISSLTAVYRLLGINRQARRVPRALEYAKANGGEAPTT